jgi:hypothetical protein
MRHLLFIFILIPFFAQAECENSVQALNRYEQEILSHAEELKVPSDVEKIAQPLRCMFDLQQNAPGMAKYMAEKYLNPFMGAPLPAAIKPSPAYLKVVAFLQGLTLSAVDPLADSVVSEYATGDWNFYHLFCEQGDTSYCPVFMPDEKQVKTQSPLLAAASLMRLRKAYQVLHGSSRDEVAQRLRRLYKNIPTGDKLQRRFIDQIYEELFNNHPLGMA